MFAEYHEDYSRDKFIASNGDLMVRNLAYGDAGMYEIYSPAGRLSATQKYEVMVIGKWKR